MQRFLSRTGLLVALSVGLSVGCDGEKGGPVVGEVTYGTTKAIEGEKWIIQLSGGTE